MNKKIPIGSLVAVVILILVSFTGVVGYQTTQSSTIAKASPLFTIRSSRAIEEESKDFTCDYVGKGEEIVLSIPKRDNINALLQKVMNRIRKMDDNEMKRLNDNIINYIQRDSNTDSDLIKQTTNIEHDIKQIWTIELECITNNNPNPFICFLGNILFAIRYLGSVIVGFLVLASIAIVSVMLGSCATFVCRF